MSYKGYIPEKVVYVCRTPTTEELYFDDCDEDIKIASFKVTETFPVEYGKKLDTAIKWTGLKKPKQIELLNSPIKKVRICNLEERGNGGRAYKVLINETYYVDMREDVVLETIINCGISKGGILQGEYVWVKYGANMKLVRIGSGLHKTFENGTNLNTLAEIKTFEIGGIYSTKKGDKLMYLGQMFTTKLQNDESGNKYDKSYKEFNYRYNAEKMYVFKKIHAYHYPKDNFKITDYKVHFNKNSSSWYYYTIQKTLPKVIIKEFQVDLSNVDYFKIIKEQIADVVKKDTYTRYSKDITWLKYFNSNILNLGYKAPEIHELFTHFNLPITKN